MSFNSVDPVAFEPVSAVTTSAGKDELGTRRTEDGVEYLYVYNAGAAQISQGEMGFLNSANSGYSVSVSNAASQAGGHLCVGVAHNATIAAGSYGYLAVQGPVLIAVDGSEISMDSGDLLAAGVDGGFVSAPASLATADRLGFAINSIVTTVGTGKAWFKSPNFS